MYKILSINSPINKPIYRSLPWASIRLGTKSVGLKEFVYDNNIENLENTFKISILKSNGSIQNEITIEKGCYELTEVLNLIRAQLSSKSIDKINFIYNKATWKVSVNNDSKYKIQLNDIASNFLKLPILIEPNSYIVANDIFNFSNSHSIYVRIKHLRDGIETDLNDIGKKDLGGVVYDGVISCNPGAQYIYKINYQKPEMFDFFQKTCNSVEIHITDENGKYVNLRNIKLQLYFELEKLN